MKVINNKVLFLVFVILFGCKTEQVANKTIPFYIEQFLSENNIETISFRLNPTKTRILCQHYSNELMTLNYTVYSLDSEEKLYEGSAIGTGVKWVSDEIIAIEGTSRLDVNQLVKINVLTKEVVK